MSRTHYFVLVYLCDKNCYILDNADAVTEVDIDESDTVADDGNTDESISEDSNNLPSKCLNGKRQIHVIDIEDFFLLFTLLATRAGVKSPTRLYVCLWHDSF